MHLSFKQSLNNKINVLQGSKCSQIYWKAGQTASLLEILTFDWTTRVEPVVPTFTRFYGYNRNNNNPNLY